MTSSFVESEMYADAGYDDILYGYPLIPSHMKKNYELTQRLEEYHLMITNKETVDILLRHDPPPGKKWSAN